MSASATNPEDQPDEDDGRDDGDDDRLDLSKSVVVSRAANDDTLDHSKSVAVSPKKADEPAKKRGLLDRISDAAAYLRDALSTSGSMQLEGQRATAQPNEDIAKTAAAGVVGGTAQVVEGAGRQVSTRPQMPVGVPGGSGANADFDLIPEDSPLRDETGRVSAPPNPLQGPADTLTQTAEGIRQSRSPAAQAAVEGSQPEGHVFQPSTWSLGKDPSGQGYVLNLLDFAGQAAPIIGAGLATRGMGAGAAPVMGGLNAAQAAGGASQQVGQVIAQIPDEKLAQVARIRELMDHGVSFETAKKVFLNEAQAQASDGATVIGLGSGAATGWAIEHGAEMLSRILPTSAAARAVVGAGAAGAEGGVAGVAQTVAGNVGVNTAGNVGAPVDAAGDKQTSQTVEPTEGALAAGALGAIGGAAMGATMGAGGSRHVPRETGERGAAAAASDQRGAGPIPQPDGTLLTASGDRVTPQEWAAASDRLKQVLMTAPDGTEHGTELPPAPAEAAPGEAAPGIEVGEGEAVEAAPPPPSDAERAAEGPPEPVPQPQVEPVPVEEARAAPAPKQDDVESAPFPETKVAAAPEPVEPSAATRDLERLRDEARIDGDADVLAALERRVQESYKADQKAHDAAQKAAAAERQRLADIELGRKLAERADAAEDPGAREQLNAEAKRLGFVREADQIPSEPSNRATDETGAEVLTPKEAKKLPKPRRAVEKAEGDMTIGQSPILRSLARAGGIDSEMLSEMRVDKRRGDGKAQSWSMGPGKGSLFKKGGKINADGIVEHMVEAGYMTEDEVARADKEDPGGALGRALEIIENEIERPGSQHPIGDLDEIARARAEKEASDRLASKADAEGVNVKGRSDREIDEELERVEHTQQEVPPPGPAGREHEPGWEVQEPKKALKGEAAQGDLFAVPEGRGTQLAPRQVDIQVKPKIDAAATRSKLKALDKTVGQVTVRKLPIPDGPVRSGQQAAQVLAHMRRAPQEQFLVLALDKDKKPIAVIRHTIGDTSSVAVYTNAIIGAIHNIPGADSVYFAHNHPSGNERASDADKRLTEMLGDLMRGSGITNEGMVIIGAGGRANFFPPGGAETPGRLAPQRRSVSVPLVERQFTQVSKRSERVISSPQELADVSRDLLDKKPGVVLMDGQMRVVGTLEMTPDEMAKLRTGDSQTGIGALAGAIDKTNSRTLGLYFTDDRPINKRAAKNMVTAGDALNVRVMDAITRGEPMSMFQNGTLPFASNSSDSARAFYSLEPARAGEARQAEADFDIIKDGPLAELDPKLKLVSAEDATKRLGAQAELARQLALIFGKRVVWVETDLFRGAVLPSVLKDAIFLNVKGNKATQAIVGHELVHHLREERPGLYQALEDDVLDNMLPERSQEYMDRMAETYRKKGIKISERQLREELVADTVGDRMLDPTFLKQLADKNPATFKRVANAMIDWLQKLVQRLRGNRGDETSALASDIDALRESVADALNLYATGQPVLSEKPVTPPSTRALFDVDNGGENRPQKRFTVQLPGERGSWTVDQAWHVMPPEDRARVERIAPELKLGTDGQVIRVPGNKDGLGDFQQQLQASRGNVMNALVRSWVANGAIPEAEFPKVISRLGLKGAEHAATADTIRYAIENDPEPTDRAPIWYSALERSIDGLKQERASAADWKNVIRGLESKGVKRDEIEWTGVNDWLDAQPGKVTKAQLQEFLRDNGVRVEERMLGGPGSVPEHLMRALSDMTPRDPGTFDYDDWMRVAARFEELAHREGDTARGEYFWDLSRAAEDQAEKMETPSGDATSTTKFSKYQAPGERSNYRELLLKLPQRDTGTDFSSSHWKDPNVLAHVRFSERTDADGKRVLWIDEIQSDWGQKGRQEGFAPPAGGTKGDSGTIPRAPFVGKTEAWTALAIKRMVRYAAEHDFDRIAFANGDQNAAHYDLSKQISRLVYEDEHSRGVGAPRMDAAEKEGILEGYDKDGVRVIEKHVLVDDLPATVGKEVADRLLAAPPKDQRTAGGNRARVRELSGVDLKVGGEGMRSFYDKIIPNVAKDVAKKLGGETTRVQINPPASPIMSFQLPAGNFGLQQRNPEGIWWQLDKNGKPSDYKDRVYFETREAADAAAAELNTTAPEQSPKHLAIDITPAMHNKVMTQGMPMFSLQGAQGQQNQNRTLRRFREFSTRVGQYLEAQFQDNLNSLKRVQRGKELDDAANTYDHEIAMHGRVTSRLKEIRTNFMDPVIKLAKKSGLTQKDVSDWLYAKHAQERNEYIASINPKMPDGGSGMKTATAKQLMGSFKPEQRAVLEKISGIVRSMNHEKLEHMVDNGLLSRESADELERRFPNYVALKDMDDEWLFDQQKFGGNGTGQGLSVRGKEFKQAFGRYSTAEDPWTMTIRDAQLAVVRSEKNRVARTVVRQILEHPDPAVWEVIDESNYPTRRALNTKNEVVEIKDSQALMRDPEYFAAKINGEQFYVRVKDPTLARQLKRIGEAHMPEGIVGLALSAVQWVTRKQSMLYTQLNADFALANPVRDLQHGMVMSTTFGDQKDRLTRKMLAELPKSITGAFKSNLAELTGKHTNSRLAAEYHEFEMAGGTTGGYGLMDADQIQRELNRAIAAVNGNRVAQVIEGGSKLMRPVMAINDTFENMTRFAIYRAARQAGYSELKAVVMAKNITVNFNKKGESSAVFNTLYAFFNASIQGSVPMVRAAFSKGGGKVRAAAALMFMLGVWAEQMGDEDETGTKEKDYVSKFKQDSNLVIPFGSEGKSITVPLAYGLNLPFIMGRRAVRVAQGKITAAKAIGESLLAILDAYSPVKGVGSALDTSTQDQGKAAIQAAAPTAVRPLVDAALNQSFTGGRIAKENPFDSNKPASSQYREGASDKAVAITRMLNELTGGDENTKGAIDISPEKAVYVGRGYLGGAALPIEIMNALSSDQELQMRDTPVVRRFVSQRDPNLYQQLARKALADAHTERKKIEADEGADEVPDYLHEMQLLERDLNHAAAKRNVAKKAGDDQDVKDYDAAIESLSREVVTLSNKHQKEATSGAR